jgi:hypothetical protein
VGQEPVIRAGGQVAIDDQDRAEPTGSRDDLAIVSGAVCVARERSRRTRSSLPAMAACARLVVTGELAVGGSVSRDRVGRGGMHGSS